MRKSVSLFTLAMLMALAFAVVGAQDETGSASADSSLLELHDAYWVSEREVEGLPRPATVINDMHIDANTNSVTVYAQSRIMGQVIAPPQVGPGECTETPAGDAVCFHPNAVYLNGSGQELMEADGTGEWWVKHAWILGGEGYLNCELRSQKEYKDCIQVEGELLEDGLSMKIGGVEEGQGFNIRTPLLNEEPIAYQVTRYGPANTDADAGEIDLTPTRKFALIWKCVEEASAFDNQARSCPGGVNGTTSQAQKSADPASVSQNPMAIPTSEQAGLHIQTVASGGPSPNNTCLNEAGETIGIQKELLKLGDFVAVVHGGGNPMPDDVWSDFSPSFPWVKNINRDTLFDDHCFYRSPTVPTDCEGAACKVIHEVADYTWMELSIIDAQDCVASGDATCAGNSPDPGAISMTITRKCHQLIYTDEIYQLADPAGNLYVMHATDTGTPDLSPALPAGWTLSLVTLDKPLEVFPFGGGDACFHNVLRDNLGQGYHQIVFADDHYPPQH